MLKFFRRKKCGDKLEGFGTDRAVCDRPFGHDPKNAHGCENAKVRANWYRVGTSVRVVNMRIN